MTEPTCKRGEIWWVKLDPTQGSEIRKTRPFVVLTHDTLNKLRKTIVVVPLSTAAKANPPICVEVQCKGKSVFAVVDQIRAVAKHRLQSKLDALSESDLHSITQGLNTLLDLK